MAPGAQRVVRRRLLPRLPPQPHRPNLGDRAKLLLWRKMEAAQHRLFYALRRFVLPLETRAEDPEHGLAFDILADPPPESSGPKVMTGHDNGLIMIALVEADDAERERRRTGMGEPYRTLLGHFRHEVGHHYWDLLVRDGGQDRLNRFRALFGDDWKDYREALQRHHGQGPPADWQGGFVSAYATAHPWEDWAETWAHYLYVVDTLEMARAYGMTVAPAVDRAGELAGAVAFDPYRSKDIGMARMIEVWLPLALALNGLNRCMGQADLYPLCSRRR